MKVACFITFPQNQELFSSEVSHICQRFSSEENLAFLIAEKDETVESLIPVLATDGYDYLIHLPLELGYGEEDLAAMLDELHKPETMDEDTLYVGCAPYAPLSLGHSLFNLLLKVESGLYCHDSLTPFRAYPLKSVSQLRCRTHGPSWYHEIFTRGLRGELRLKEVSLSTKNRTVPPLSFWNSLVLLVMHGLIILQTLCFIKGKKIARNPRPKEGFSLREVMCHPIRFILFLLRENATPIQLAYAAAIGSFIAVLPIPGLHVIAVLYVSIRFRLNKIMAMTIQNLYAPPFAPLFCLAVGHFIRKGVWLHDLKWDSCLQEIPHFFLDWVLGSCLCAPFIAVIAGFVIYGIALLCQKLIPTQADPHTEAE